MPNRIVRAAGVSALLMLIACGKSTDLENAGAEVPADRAEPAGNATAEEVAAEARGDVGCPATARTPRPAGAPVDDVVGVRPGMSWGEAAHFVMCDNPLLVVKEVGNRGYQLNTYGTKIRQGFEARFAEPRIVKTGKQIVREMQDSFTRSSGNYYEAPMEPGQSRWFVSTMGVPEQERVISVAREEYYPADTLPAFTNIERALIAKYGSPLRRSEGRSRNSFEGGSLSLNWGYDPTGRPITETSPLAFRCGGHSSPDASTSLSPDCGVIISATITRSPTNPGLVKSLAVASQNSAEGFARLKSTERALMQADAERRAKEVEGASKSAVQPKL